MMIKNKVNYEKAVNQIIAQGASRQALFSMLNDMVDSLGRDGGFLAYKLLNDALDRGLPSDAEDILLDMLDALSGQCSPRCFIGSADYHLAAQAA